MFKSKDKADPAKAAETQEQASTDDAKAADEAKAKDKAPEDKRIKVVAIKSGYYGGEIREPGKEFRLEDEEHFSTSWMKRKEA